MSSNLTGLRVFIASPGGLGDERRAFRDEISEYNKAETILRGVVFQAIGWEDTLGAVGRPQTAGICTRTVCEGTIRPLPLESHGDGNSVAAHLRQQIGRWAVVVPGGRHTRVGASASVPRRRSSGRRACRAP